MRSVFISSLQSGFEDVRRATKKAVESLGMFPLMAESTGASGESPRRALLDKVAEADIFLLLFGARYGERGESGYSPTEDEFREAERLGKAILVLKQNVEMDSDQQEFLARTRGSWEAGKLSGSFNDAGDVGLEVVKALRGLEAREASTPSTDLIQAAQERARVLAEGDERPNTTGSGSKARFVAAPVLGRAILRAVDLDDQGLVDDLADRVRSNRLVTQAMGLESTVSGEGVCFSAKDRQAFETIRIFLGTDGAVTTEGAVGGEDKFFSGMQVYEPRLIDVVRSAVRFAIAVWQRIDVHDDVRQAAVTVAIPDATQKVYTTAPVGGSISGPSFSMPHVVIAPEPAIVIRRENLADEETIRSLVSEIKRRFADAGGVHEQ